MLLLVALGDGEFAAVVAALGAYMVIHNSCAAVAAGAQLAGFQRVVRSSFGRSRLRESVFRMWHIITFLIYLFQFFQCFPAGVDVAFGTGGVLVGEKPDHLGVAFSVGVCAEEGDLDGYVFVD